MADVSSKLTVFFEEPFWVGVYERQCAGRYEVSKITFGAEPKDCEVYAFLLRNWSGLKFSRTAESGRSGDRPCGPKRMQRTVARQLRQKGVGTKAQQSLKLQHEQAKAERKLSIREAREAEKERRFALRQKKREEKHRGH